MPELDACVELQIVLLKTPCENSSIGNLIGFYDISDDVDYFSLNQPTLRRFLL
jgi:hypothetical protein